MVDFRTVAADTNFQIVRLPDDGDGLSYLIKSVLSCDIKNYELVTASSDETSSLRKIQG
jgi:hypothetical protein